MSRRAKEAREGYCIVYSKDGGQYHIARSNFHPLCTEWVAGHTFYSGTGFYGEAFRVKLAEVQAVSDVDPATLARLRADCAADDDEDRARSVFSTE